jgi:hypothetical protein
MTRNQDILTTLRSLDAADPDVDPRGARARADLARILATAPFGHPSQSPSPRAGGRSNRSLGSSRRAWRLALAGGMVTAVTAPVVVAQSLAGGDRAFATWTPTPAGMSAEASADAAGECRDAQENGPGADYEGDLGGAEAVIVERRGVWTTVVLAARNGFSALCITDDSTRIFGDWFGSIGTPSGYTTPGPRDLVATDLGTGVIDAGQLSLAAGVAGSGVAEVVYRSRDHGDVAATVAKGRFALWLPGDELEDAATTGVQVEVTYRDGSTRTSRLHLR